MRQAKLTRRRVLVAGGTAAVLLAGSQLWTPAGQRLLFVDADLTARDLRTVDALAPGKTQPLERDLVQHWRRTLRASVLSNGTASAFVRWDKAMILAGLAREERLSVQQIRLGRSLFRVDLG